MGNDEVLSEILEGVIDIQEILPNPATATAVTPSVTATIPPEASKSTMSSEIENIEKFLVGSPSAGSTATVAASTAAVPVSSRYQQPSQSHQRHKSGPITMVTVGVSYPPPIQTTASSSESSSLAASNNNQQIRQREEQLQQIQQRRQQQTHHTARRQNSAPGLHSALSGRGSGSGSSAPVALVPRMNELLQQVPPNVSIPDCPDLVNKLDTQIYFVFVIPFC